MKSPWKFLGDLLSRGRSAEPEDGRNSHDEDAKARPIQMQEIPTPPSPSVEGSLQSHADDITPIAETDLNKAEENADVSAAASAALVGEDPGTPAHDRESGDRSNAGAVSQRKAAAKQVPPGPRTKRAGQAKKTSTDTLGQAAEAPNEQESYAAPSQDSFYAEVENVDAEVQRLKRQLADALALQNAQLRTMLQRFGVS